MKIKGEKENARKRRKVRNAVVHRDARRKCESCTAGERERENQSSLA